MQRTRSTINTKAPFLYSFAPCILYTDDCGQPQLLREPPLLPACGNEGNRTLELTLDKRSLCHSATLPNCFVAGARVELALKDYEPSVLPLHYPTICTDRGNRTPNPVMASDLKSDVYTVPPYRHVVKELSRESENWTQSSRSQTAHASVTFNPVENKYLWGV